MVPKQGSPRPRGPPWPQFLSRRSMCGQRRGAIIGLPKPAIPGRKARDLTLSMLRALAQRLMLAAMIAGLLLPAAASAQTAGAQAYINDVFGPDEVQGPGG